MLLTTRLHLALFVQLHCLRAVEAERPPYHDSSNGLRSVGEKPDQAQNAKIPLRETGNTSVEINEKHRYSIGVQKKLETGQPEKDLEKYGRGQISQSLQYDI